MWCMELGAIGGCEGVIVCDSREMRAKRQVVEGGMVDLGKPLLKVSKEKHGLF